MSRIIQLWLIAIIISFVFVTSISAQDTSAETCEDQLEAYQTAYSQLEQAEEALSEPTRQAQALMELLTVANEGLEAANSAAYNLAGNIGLPLLGGRLPTHYLTVRKVGNTRIPVTELISYCVLPIRGTYADAITALCQAFWTNDIISDINEDMSVIRSDYTLGDLTIDISTAITNYYALEELLPVDQNEINTLVENLTIATNSRDTALETAWETYSNYQGCVDQNKPDADNDIVPDGIDACPNIPGDVIYDGCPLPQFEPPEAPVGTCLSLDPEYGSNCTTEYEPIYGCKYLGNDIYRWESWELVYVAGELFAEVYVGGPYIGSWHDGCPTADDPGAIPDQSIEPTQDSLMCDVDLTSSQIPITLINCCNYRSQSMPNLDINYCVSQLEANCMYANSPGRPLFNLECRDQVMSELDQQYSNGTIPDTSVNVEDVNRLRCEYSPTILLSVGTFAQVVSEFLTVYDQPFTYNREVGFLNANTKVEIIDGPECLNGVTWWQIQDENGLSGWVAEAVYEDYHLIPDTPEITIEMSNAIRSICEEAQETHNIDSPTECYDLIANNCVISGTQLNFTCKDGVLGQLELVTPPNETTGLSVPESGEWSYTWSYSVGKCPDGTEVVSESFNAPFELPVILTVSEDGSTFNMWFVNGTNLETPIMFSRVEDGFYEATTHTLPSSSMQGEFRYEARVLFSNEIELTEYSPFPLLGGSDPNNLISCPRERPGTLTLVAAQ